MVREEINPRDSWRASKAFRLQIGGEIASRALKESIRRGMVSGVVVEDKHQNIAGDKVTGGEQ